MSLSHKVYKYPLSINDEQVIKVPPGFEPLSVQMQRENLCLWAIVYDGDKSPDKHVLIRIVGTGHPLFDYRNLNFIGTVQVGVLVFHVFWKFVKVKHG